MPLSQGNRRYLDWLASGVSQVPDSSFRARCLLSPRGVRSVRLIEASQPMLASPHPAGWPLPFKCNEAEPSSRDATARAFAFPSLDGKDCSSPLRGWLHDSRPIIMTNTFQLTRTTKLAWRFPDEHGFESQNHALPFEAWILEIQNQADAELRDAEAAASIPLRAADPRFHPCPSVFIRGLKSQFNTSASAIPPPPATFRKRLLRRRCAWAISFSPGCLPPRRKAAGR